MLNKKFFADRFVAMLEGGQIICIISSKQVKVIAANNWQRFDFTELVGECLKVFANKPRSIKGDATDLVSQTLKVLIDEGFCSFSFKDTYDRDAYVEQKISKFYM